MSQEEKDDKYYELQQENPLFLRNLSFEDYQQVCVMIIELEHDMIAEMIAEQYPEILEGYIEWHQSKQNPQQVSPVRQISPEPPIPFEQPEPQVVESDEDQEDPEEHQEPSAKHIEPAPEVPPVPKIREKLIGKVQPVVENAPVKPPIEHNPQKQQKNKIPGSRQSKLRFVEVLAGVHADNGVFTNIHNVNNRLPLDTNGACASNQMLAVPLSQPGLVVILDLKRPGRLDDNLNVLRNGSQVCDMQWCPYQDNVLAVGLQNGTVNLWQITKIGDNLSELLPRLTISTRSGAKIVSLKWLAHAADIIAIGTANGSLEIWNTKADPEFIQFVDENSNSPVLSFCWNMTGTRLAVLRKNLNLSLHAPRDQHILECKKVLDYFKAARIFYCCQDTMLAAISFTKASQRQIQLFDSTTLEQLYIKQLDEGTQLLIPHYDYDTSALILSAKGDRTVRMFEIIRQEPWLIELEKPNEAFQDGCQSIAYQNKSVCDVMQVEFLCAWRVTEKAIEKLSFRVPRVQKGVFHADIFPDALMTWRPVMNADEWICSVQKDPVFISLRSSSR